VCVCVCVCVCENIDIHLRVNSNRDASYIKKVTVFLARNSNTDSAD